MQENNNSKPIHIVFQVLNLIFRSKKFKLLLVDKLILVALASHKGLKGIFPMQETLANEIGITRRHLRNRIKILEKNGLLFVEKIGRRSYYHLQNLSTIEELQCPYSDSIGELQFPSQGNYSSSHRGTTVATNNKVSNKRNNRERARKKRVPLSADFLPTKETVEYVKNLGYSQDEIDTIAADFMNHYLDSDMVSNNWDAKARKWFRDEKRQPGFLEEQPPLQRTSTVKDYTPAKTPPRTEQTNTVAREALANILEKLGKPNGARRLLNGQDHGRVDTGS
jgi:biotin operon repressor